MDIRRNHIAGAPFTRPVLNAIASIFVASLIYTSIEYVTKTAHHNLASVISKVLYSF